MSKLLAIIRRFFLKKEEGQKNSTSDNDEPQHTPNDVQTVVKAPRHYDEVVLDEDGSGPKLQQTETTSSNVQVPPKRAQRSYEEVDLPPPDSGSLTEPTNVKIQGKMKHV